MSILDPNKKTKAQKKQEALASQLTAQPAPQPNTPTSKTRNAEHAAGTPSPKKASAHQAVEKSQIRAARQAQQSAQLIQTSVAQTAPPAQNQTKKTSLKAALKKNEVSTLKIIPLGGLNEIGKNLTVFQTENDIFVLDCGLAFPDYETPGVDVIIPDFTYLERNAEKIKGIVITHGHEDHIGGIPYLLKKINVPVYGSRLTLGLLSHKLKEHNLLSRTKLVAVSYGQIVKMGCMSIEFLRVNHSIPDSMGMAITSPAGVVVHTGDFKVDYTPINSGIIDLMRFGELGSKGVLALMSDSTNAERAGYTASERTVGESFDRLFSRAADKRIIIATFASNVHRVQQAINSAQRNGRKVAVFGRSMLNVIATAIELGCLTVPSGVLIEADEIPKYESGEIVLITTGSQGEPLSALTRMSTNEHKQVTINSNDFIIISANPIPGNEKHVTRVINDLLKSGAEVIHESMYEVHVSGHACQEELKLMLALTRPKFFIPVHGEYKHLAKHASIALTMGVPETNVLVANTGNVIELEPNKMKVVSQVVSGNTYVDGLGVGDVGSIVLRDRRHLADDGLIVVVFSFQGEKITAGPEIISRGFVYVREAEKLMDDIKEVIVNTVRTLTKPEHHDWTLLKQKVRDALADYIFRETKRSPMILPIIMESKINKA